MSSMPTQQRLPPFDELVKLAERDPEAFNRFKHQLCDEMIASASDFMQDRLRAQQSHIDLLISHCSNPTHVNVTLQSELFKQFAKFREALNGELDIAPTSADVVPFRPKEKDWR
ncbi:DUF3135 domain-containing protein [Vibrio sp. V39_P1S14PM300]|uniref:DUF3135 domain-containing protein n=1 Tax=Vibrio sp. V39_P1S14PM300 TaxID=1938690 RepID=UPI0013731EFC|nr:DUF3135 domain-containing protein [Vibrio sp. V39_P1S14PM300]NAX21334.1 DUF3135 domain-containing protein [Vibrio sp. V39_P1S14PM300]